MKMKLTELSIGHNGEFSATFGDAQHHNLIALRRLRHHDNPVGDTEISFPSNRTGADGAYDFADALLKVAGIAIRLNALAAQGNVGRIEASLQCGGFSLDTARVWVRK